MRDTAKSYEYKRFMRDGSVKEVTAVVRSKTANRKSKENKKNGRS